MYHLTDTEFARQFADCTLDPSLFSHEGHLRLAWIHLTTYGLEQAIGNIRTQIQAFDKAHGDGTKYHETLTVASLQIVDHFIRKSSAKTFQEFLLEFPNLGTNFKDLVAQHYTNAVLADIRAKAIYQEPDLHPFE